MLGITHHGDVPYVVRGVQQDYTELFYQPGGEDRTLFIPIHHPVIFILYTFHYQGRIKLLIWVK